MITWLSRRQTSISISEAEVIAASDACREIVWLKRLLKRITCLKNESVLYINNKGSVTRLGLKVAYIYFYILYHIQNYLSNNLLLI